MIIALSGYARSGKDEVAKFICELDPTFQIRKFSGKLKEMASMLTSIPVSMFEDQRFKMAPLGREWWSTNEEGTVPMTVRDLLQRLGTDAIRDGLHPNAWVNALMSEYRWQNWVITDCRFPNEAQAVKDNGGVVVRIDRPGVGPINGHPSETALDDWDFDYKIMNGSDLTALRFTTEVILNKIL